MTYATQITKLGGTARHAEFAAFIESSLNGRTMPDYKSLDLMQIPRLVPGIWVIDGRAGFEEGLKFLFSGTEIDRHFGRNMMGDYLRENYAEHYSKEAYAAYRDVFSDKRPVYIERSDYYPGVEPEVERRIKVLLFPCSSDGDIVDFAIGYTVFEKTDARRLGRPLIVRLPLRTP